MKILLRLLSIFCAFFIAGLFYQTKLFAASQTVPLIQGAPVSILLSQDEEGEEDDSVANEEDDSENLKDNGDENNDDNSVDEYNYGDED